LEHINETFLSPLVNLPGSNVETPFYLNPGKRVNVIFVFVLEARWRLSPERSGDQVKFYGHL
jgi:hypothetical protein